MEENQGERIQLFAEQLRTARIEEMTNMLRCKLCNGLLRFAHTLIECGHTFCQQCIFAYIRGFKGRHPDVKCPQCHAPLEPIYHRSVIRDVFKQSLVDLLEPNFAEREKLIIERIRKLFPEFNLAFLLDEFSFTTSTSPIDTDGFRKRAEKTKIMSGLTAMVRDKLGLSFQTFAEQVADDQKYLGLVQKIGSVDLEVKRPDFLLLDIRPRTQRDLHFVGINGKLRVTNFQVLKIRKFMQKSLLLRMQNSQELSREIIANPDSPLQVRIELFLENRVLEDGENLLELPAALEKPLLYSLLV